MARQNKEWFFEIGNTNRFKDGDKPNRNTFEELLDSTTFPTELEDRAKLTEAGLAKTTTDVKVNACNDKDIAGVSPCGFPTFVKPSQIPKILQGSCVRIDRINRTTGVSPTAYSFNPIVSSFSHNATVPESTYNISIYGIAAGLVDTIEVGTNPTPSTQVTFTNNGGILVVPVVLGATASNVFIVRITMKSTLIYDVIFTLTHTPPGSTGDAVLSSAVISAPPYNPNILSEDGSEIEDYMISIDTQCLGLPQDSDDIPFGGINSKDLDLVTYDPLTPVSPCNATINTRQVETSDSLQVAFCKLLEDHNTTARTVKSLSDYVCTLEQQINNGNNTTIDGLIELGDTTVSFIPPNFWGSSYLEPNGQAISRTTYAALFAIIGTSYGAGDGSTTFNLPNIAAGDYIRLTNSSTLSGGFAGGTGGSNSHVLVQDNIPEHGHSFGGGTTGDASVPHTHEIITYTETIGAGAGGGPHNYGLNVAAAGQDAGVSPAWAQDSLKAVTISTDLPNSTNNTSHSHAFPSGNTGNYGKSNPDAIPITPQYREFYLKMRVK